jgi:hypothetical protein
MNVQFNLNGISLKQSEAETLLTTAGAPSIQLDISKYLSKGQVNVKKLFDLSIEKQRPELAALAAKLAIQAPAHQQEQPEPKARQRRKGIRRLHEVEATDVPAIECLDYLLTHKKLGSIGAAMIIETVGVGRPTTLRDIAVEQVNRAWNKGISEHSTIFRGFEDNGKSFVPIVTRAEKGGTTFHASPLYNALREGLKYLVKNGLAEATAKTSWGSEDKELTDNEKQLCRTVYEVTLSDKGKELHEIWADAEKFIYSYWEERVV